MDSPGEILRLCRLCLVKDQVNIPIFEEEGDSREIFLKISSCLPVKVSREDRLPKKICDGCSEKLNSFYEFWSSSANAEKTLLSWVGEEDVEEKKEPAVSKSLAASATLVKEESELVDEAHAESIEESTKDEADEAPPAKRARRSAAVKAQINLAPDSEDDDLDMGEPLTKTEEESAESDGEDKDPSYTDMPGTSADDEQAGPSGMGKDGVEAPNPINLLSVKFSKFTCVHCEEDFAKRQELRRHLKAKHQEVLTCRGCGKVFKTTRALSVHVKCCRVEKGSLQCEICQKVLGSKQSLVAHTKRHLRLYDYKCEFCGKGFFSTGSLKLHINSRHTGKTEFICEICERPCYDKNSLKNHTEKHRPDYRNKSKVKCDQCDFTFLDEKYLRIHQTNKHSTDRRFVCDLCGKKLYSKTSLVDHLNIHKGLKPHKCHYCSIGFANSTTLRLHLRRHTGEKPYKCDLCDKAFVQSHSLKVHMRTHTGEKPYVCNICSKAFVSSSVLKSHMKYNHKME